MPDASLPPLDLESLADEIIDAIRAEVPPYARPLEGEFGKGVRGGVTQALARFAGGSPPGGAVRNVYVELGRGEARQGRTLEALLAAYRVGARIAWRRVAAAGLEAGLPPEQLVALAEAIFAYIDQLSAESAEGFAQEQADRAGETERRRAAVVALLTRDPPPTEEAVLAAAEAAAWPLPRDVAFAVWDAAHGRRPVRRLPQGSLTAEIDGLVCAVIPDPAAPGRRTELRRIFGDLPAAVGPAVPAAKGGRSYRRAIAALPLAHEGLLFADEHRAALLVRVDAGLVDEIAAHRLQPLDDETPASRQRLEATLLAWLRRDGDVSAAAADLAIHAQTVRYRLARLRELLGDALDDPDARFELEAALRARAIAT